MIDLWVILCVLGLGVALARVLRRPPVVPWKHCRRHNFLFLYASACPHCLAARQ